MRSELKDKIFDTVITVVVAILVIICLAPILNVAATSLSSDNAVMGKQVYLWPVGWNFEAYKAVLNDPTMIRSMGFTVVLTVAFTLLSMFMTIMCAYPLTKTKLKGRTLFLFLIVVTMYFQGGMIPDYILIKDLGILNTVWCLLLPQCISAYNMIILKTFFSNIPESLEESAYLDGASHLVILVKIIIPLSTPVLATLSLFYAVWRWNAFNDSLFYITKPALYPLQLKLYQIVYNNMSLEIGQFEGVQAQRLLPESLKAASVMFATIPILLVYPWLQKYFISGVMIGAIKG